MLFVSLIAFTAAFMQGAADNSEVQCYTDISGIYIRKYLDSPDSTYGLTYYLTRGGVLQFDSGEKQNIGAYYSDVSGTYHCQSRRRGQAAKLSTEGFRYRQRGNNLTIELLKFSVICRGAIDACSDRSVTCSDGQVTSRSYQADIPNATTGEFEHPIPNSMTSRRYKSVRLYTHPVVTSADQDRCYTDLSGLYVEKYEDGSFDVTAYGSFGYLFSINSAEQNPNGTYGSGSAVGEWFCNDRGSRSGRYNYFTYADTTAQQRLIDGTFSQQCTKDEYSTCNGTFSEIPYPLQYQRPPFRDGRYDEVSSGFTVSSRLFKTPTLKACHETYAGSYGAVSVLPRTGEKIFSTTYLYRNGLIFSGLLSLVAQRSNIIGVWDCDSEGNVQLNTVEIMTLPTNQSSKLVFALVLGESHCPGTGEPCMGSDKVYFSKSLELPVNGSFPSMTYATTLPLTSVKLKNAG